MADQLKHSPGAIVRTVISFEVLSKGENTRREQHLGVIAARIKGQGKRTDNVYTDSGPDPWHQGIITFETQIKPL